MAATSQQRDSRSQARRRWRGVLCLMSGLVLLVACSVNEDYETLSFWFDGVPTPEQLEAKRLADEQRAALMAGEDLGPLSSEQRAALLAVRVEVEEASSHQPFNEKKCTACHVMTGSTEEGASAGWMSDLPELKVPPSELCLGCHQRPEASYLHGPAASGNCSICHEAHLSYNQHLLRNKNQERLCRSCHQQETFLTEEAHSVLGERDCVECHNPHGAEREYLLRPQVAGLEWVPESTE